MNFIWNKLLNKAERIIIIIVIYIEPNNFRLLISIDSLQLELLEGSILTVYKPVALSLIVRLDKLVNFFRSLYFIDNIVLLFILDSLNYNFLKSF